MHMVPQATSHCLTCNSYSPYMVINVEMLHIYLFIALILVSISIKYTK